MVREVADHQDILRSLGKTVLVRLLAKKHVGALWGRERNTNWCLLTVLTWDWGQVEVEVKHYTVKHRSAVNQ